MLKVERESKITKYTSLPTRRDVIRNIWVLTHVLFKKQHRILYVYPDETRDLGNLIR